MLNRIFPPPAATSNDRFTAGTFLLVLAQVAVLFGIIGYWEIERQSGLTLVLPWAAAGFVLHALMPLRFRAAFFVLLTVAALIWLAGPLSGMLVAAAILVLLGIGHLPLGWGIRVALQLGAGAVMTALHMQLVYAPRLNIAAGIAGLFVMFRLILYMYELKHEQKKAGVWERLSYFFMLPNLCFPLFPIIDYKTWLRCRYAEPLPEIWRSGIRKILRGCVHLIIYRIIYTHLVPSPATLHGPLELAAYIATAYLLVLRMSGVFYIALGMLHLFGYSLPPVFDNFFLISGFGQIWRRINIYWKDFVTKLVYYPLWFRLRKVNGINAVFVTGIITFFVTWQLHSWQWFWVLGRFPFSLMDAIYWLTLGVVITWSLVKAAQPQTESREAGWTLRGALIKVLRIAGIFLFMSVLWSFWNSKSVSGWLYLMTHALNGTAADYLLLAGCVAGLLALGVLAHYVVYRTGFDNNKPMRVGYTALAVCVAGGILLVPLHNSVQTMLPPAVKQFIATLQHTQLNRYDRENAEQGYYEQLLEDPTRSNPFQRRIFVKGKPGSDKITQPDNSILQRKLRPNSKLAQDGYTISINRWGMRDKDYPLEKPAGTFRIALLGGSYEMGTGVSDGQNYESLLEEMLNNKDSTIKASQHIEILNFAVPGYHALQHAWQAKHEIWRFQPDMVIYVAHSEDPRRLNGFFASLVSNGVPLQYQFLEEIKDKSGAAQTQSRDEIRNRMLPYNDTLLGWAYSEMAMQCIFHNTPIVWLYLPATADEVNIAERNRMQQQAQNLGFITVVLQNPYGNTPREALQIGNGDTHPNAKGHQLIARAVYAKISGNNIPGIPLYSTSGQFVPAPGNQYLSK
ncbi:MAG: SGNH/GDSL hydrolase family protein [Bacteroidetes bacterium]|nr:SGNH/GDSL hydrolase family protein [Bacteroidota bacterium]